MLDGCGPCAKARQGKGEPIRGLVKAERALALERWGGRAILPFKDRLSGPFIDRLLERKGAHPSAEFFISLAPLLRRKGGKARVRRDQHGGVDGRAAPLEELP